MTQSPEHGPHTRMIFMGQSVLTDGFRLIGFETLADPTVQEVERLVRELVNRNQNAFVVIDQQLARADIPIIKQVRSEGGHIVITSVPPLNDPGAFRCAIDDRLQNLLNASNLFGQS